MTDIPFHRTRPGADAIAPATRSRPADLGDGIFCSPGLSNSYLLTTSGGRVVINTGMGFEGGIHRANFDEVDGSSTRYVLLTQGHYDHVGGVDQFLGAGTDVVAHENFTVWRDDNERLEAFRSRNAAFAWIDAIMAAVAHAQEFGDGDIPAQSRPEPTITFRDQLELDVGDRRIVLLSTPGGETTDSMIVWLPESRTLFTGNVFGPLFGHVPNLVTIRGDRYRDPLQYIESVQTVIDLAPDRVITGHFEPIQGAALIRTELQRMVEATRFIHDRTVDGMNAGVDVFTLMRDIRLPDHLDVGEGYGTVRWNVRAIWEQYAGWFHHRSTAELYGVAPGAASPEIVALAGADRLVSTASSLVDDGRPVEAIQLTDIVLSVSPTHAEGRQVAARAHEHLLTATDNFWERAWLRRAIDRLRSDT